MLELPPSPLISFSRVKLKQAKFYIIQVKKFDIKLTSNRNDLYILVRETLIVAL